MRYLAIVIILFNSNGINAQLNADSLRAQWNNKKQTDSLRLDAVKKLSHDVLLYTNEDSAIHYAEKQFEYAKVKQLEFHMAHALNTLGIIASNRQEFSKSITYYKQSLDLRQNIKDMEGIGSSLNNLAGSYIKVGFVSRGLNCYKRAIKILDETDKNEFKAYTLGNIGYQYQMQKDYDMALSYYNQCLDILKDLGMEKNIGAIVFRSAVANIYKELKQYDKALEILHKTLEYVISTDKKLLIGKARFMIAVVLLEQDKFVEAGIKLEAALKSFKEVNDKQGEVGVHLGKGLLNVELGKFNKAIAECDIAYTYSKTEAIIDLEKNACDCLYKANKRLGNGTEALQFLEKLQTLTKTINDSMNTAETAKKLQQMEYERQFFEDSLAHVEELRLAQLEKDKIATAKSRKNRIQYSLVVIAVLLLATVIAVATKFKISPRLASGLIFIFFILSFEFLLVVLDPWVDSISDGEVGWKIGINTAIALGLFGIHQASEKKLKNAILK
ncbi:MAG: tetratricopeptide repeat protein [Bacteroidia bacterium]